MRASTRVSVLLGQTKIDDEQLVAVTANSHQKVIRLNVTVNEVFDLNHHNQFNALNRVKHTCIYSIRPII